MCDLLFLLISSLLYTVQAQDESTPACTATIASIGTILTGNPPTLRNIVQFNTKAHQTTCFQLQMPDGSNRRNITVSIGESRVTARVDVPRIVAPNSVPTLKCDDGCGDGYSPNNLYNWRDTQCLNKPDASYAQAAPRIVDHNDCHHNPVTGAAGSPNYGYTGICLGGQENIYQIIGLTDPMVGFTVNGPDFSCSGKLTNDLVSCGVNSTIEITSTTSSLASNIMNRFVSFDRNCVLPTYLNPGRGCSDPSSQMWFSVLNKDEASQCLLTRLNQAYWAGDPHCQNVGYDGASRTAVWDWHDCTQNGGDNVGLSLTYYPDQKNVMNDDVNAVVQVKLDILSYIAYVDYAIAKCTLVSATGNVQEASAAVSVIVRVQESTLHQCGCRTANDEVINLACVSGYCVSNVPLSNYTTTTLCSLNCVTLNLTIQEWNTTHTQYGEVISSVHHDPPGDNGGLGGFFDSIANSVTAMLFEFGRIWDIASCGVSVSCLLKSILGAILSLAVYGLIGGVLYKLYKHCRARSSSNNKVKVLVAAAEKNKPTATEMAQLP